MCRNPVKLRTGPRDDTSQHNTQLEKHSTTEGLGKSQCNLLVKQSWVPLVSK